MTETTAGSRRLALRQILERPRVTHPASVFDAASARLAAAAGYELSMLAGSLASAVALAAPDLVVLTLTEFAEQVRRISRAGSLPLFVDADHGYGNALNVRRTVEELEAAGLAGLTIEDTVLPRPFGAAASAVISRDEFAGKLRAAVDARADASLCVIGRTVVLNRYGLDEAVARVRICAAAGVDAIMLIGATTLEQIEAVHAAVDLPLILGSVPPIEGDLAQQGVRIALQGHLPYYVALGGLYEAYRHLAAGGAPDELRARTLAADLQAAAFAEGDYVRWTRDYLGAS